MLDLAGKNRYFFHELSKKFECALSLPSDSIYRARARVLMLVFVLQGRRRSALRAQVQRDALRRVAHIWRGGAHGGAGRVPARRCRGGVVNMQLTCSCIVCQLFVVSCLRPA